MKYIKILGLLAVAAAALMAFVASASATTITSPTNTSYTGTIKATTENGHAKLENPIAKVECHGFVEGKVETHGTGSTAKGNLTALTWGTNGNLNGICTNSWHVTTSALGSLEVHWKGEHEGTLTSKNTQVDTTRLGVTCVYETEATGTDIGTFTDSHKTGTTAAPSTATFHIEANIPINKPLSSGLCGEEPAKWEGSYKVESPDTLYIDKE